MQQLASFLSGTWQSGRGRSRLIHHAISGEALWEVTSEGLDMALPASLPLKKVPPPFAL
ncbi:bifunctional aldehyde dehydrogenase/enoyl-CoA hydratase [Escherichia coli]|nr:bifunctional aldehyde dehydrogenase/enoyl-CoA hydratase [Escherichia coli]